LLLLVPRIPDSIRKPGQIFAERPGTLKSLYAHARDLIKLQDQLRELVPGDYTVAALEDGDLHLITPSAALATRLRYHSKRLIASMPRQLKVRKIKISVRPDLVQTRSREQEPRTLSPESASHLAATAKYIEDAALRKALIRLSKRATSKSK
jgi:hypothetical protein